LNENSALFRLINEFSKLPGIGRKTAERLAFHILKEDEVNARRLSEAILEVKSRMKFCSICFNITEDDPCDICSDTGRDKKVICVVEEPRDILAIEKSATYNGVYHVLMGAISPLNGVSPDDLKIRELLKRINEQDVSEVIVATNPNVEGDTTALYLARLIKPLGVNVTRIARGLPVGGDLEYADSVTLSKAISGRTPI